MTIEKYNRSGGYKYVAYDNDGKVLIITSSKIALKAANVIKSIYKVPPPGTILK